MLICLGQSSSASGAFNLRDNNLDDMNYSAPSTFSSHAQSFLPSDYSRTPSSLLSENNAPSSPVYPPSKRADSGTEAPDCQCLKSMLHLLDALQIYTSTANQRYISAVLAFHKQALTASNKVLGCRTCDSRFQYIALLGIIGEKIATLCEAILTAFLRCGQNGSSRCQDPGVNPSKLTNVEDKIRVGAFEIDTHKERKVLVAALIMLQFKNSIVYVGRTKESAVATNRLGQVQGLQKVEQKLKTLYERMQQLAPDAD